MSINDAKGRNLLTQKDLMSRWGCTVRTIQRTRKEFGLEPVDFYGVNPLFHPAEVERVEQMRKAKLLAWNKRLSNRRKRANIISVKEAKRLAKGRGKL